MAAMHLRERFVQKRVHHAFGASCFPNRVSTQHSTCLMDYRTRSALATSRRTRGRPVSVAACANATNGARQMAGGQNHPDAPGNATSGNAHPTPRPWCGFRWRVWKLGSTTIHRIRSFARGIYCNLHTCRQRTGTDIRKTTAKPFERDGRSHANKLWRL